MMGIPTLYCGGKAFAGLFGDSMVFKLEGEAHAAALALPGAMLLRSVGDGTADEGLGARSVGARVGVAGPCPIERAEAS